ncbi:unnamed protein product, partial [Symbiodinium sp. KB8]
EGLQRAQRRLSRGLPACDSSRRRFRAGVREAVSAGGRPLQARGCGGSLAGFPALPGHAKAACRPKGVWQPQ